MEIIKHYYLYRNGLWSVWFIPFQLCSMPMYLWIFKHSSLYKIYLYFILYYGLIGAVFAFIYPSDIISHTKFLMIHSFLWHYIIVFMAGIICGNNKANVYDFIKATILFLSMCIMATIINYIGIKYGDINMFYISCISDSQQIIVADLIPYLQVYGANVLYIMAIIILAIVNYMII